MENLYIVAFVLAIAFGNSLSVWLVARTNFREYKHLDRLDVQSLLPSQLKDYKRCKMLLVTSRIAIIGTALTAGICVYLVSGGPA